MTFTAIQTFTLLETATRPTRIKAVTMSAHLMSVTISFPIEESGEAAHRIALEALCTKMNWPAEKYIAGATAHGYVFVRPETLQGFGI